MIRFCLAVNAIAALACGGAFAAHGLATSGGWSPGYAIAAGMVSGVLLSFLITVGAMGDDR